MQIFGNGLVDSFGTGTLPQKDEVAFCEQWLMKYAKPARVPRDDMVFSYSLKHRIEKDHPHGYVSNGALIQAAVNLEYEFIQDGHGSPNALFHMRLRLPEDAWKRVRPRHFTRWMFKNCRNYDLYQDAKDDPQWPRQSKDFGDFYSYLYRTAAINEFLHLWEWYTREEAYRPEDFPIDEVMSADPDDLEFNSEQIDVLHYGEEFPDAPDGYTYLYALCDTNDKWGKPNLRYIGQTVSPATRLVQHTLNPGNLDKLDWIAELRGRDEFPYMVVFDRVPVTQANNKERFAVFYFSWAARMPGQSWQDALLNKAYA